MKLMVVKDVMLGENGQTILTGPLLLRGFARRSEVERAFVENIAVLNMAAEQVRVQVRGISVSQAMSGRWQVSVAIDYPSERSAVASESLVTS